MVGALVFLILVLSLLMTPNYSEGKFEITVCQRGHKGRFGRCRPKSIPCNGDAHLDRSCQPTFHCCVLKRRRKPNLKKKSHRGTKIRRLKNIVKKAL